MSQRSDNPSEKRKQRRRNALRRKIPLRWLGMGLVATVVVLIALHTVILRAVAVRTLEGQVGCDVSIGSARLGAGGSVVLRNVRLSAPGIDGVGGVFLESASVRAEIDWATLMAGGQGVRRLRLVDPVARLSQDARTGELNLLRVGGSGGSGGAVTPLPEVEFVLGRVEFGEHDGDAYTVLASIPVQGQVRAPSIASTEYEIDLVEIIEDESRPPMRLTGDFDVNALTGELDLVDLDLDRWQGWSAPVRARALWKEMNIRGRIAEARFVASRDASVTAWFRLDGVRLTAPIRAPGVDTDLINARDVDGIIRFTEEGLRADLVGIVEDLPVQMEFRTEGLSVTAPLSCTIATDRYRLSEKPGLLRFAPGEARELFEEFGGPTGEVSGYVTLSRGPTLGGIAAPIVARGELRFENARGEHEVFPYPVEAMTGAVRFDEHEIELIDVRGVSPTGATLIATGTIAPPTEGTTVDILLDLRSIPTDATLDRAMPPEARSVLRTLVHRPALAGLRERGLLITSDDLVGLEARIGMLREELMAHAPGEGGSAIRRVEIEREIGRLEERLRLPVFDLGGLGNTLVRIERDGPEDELSTTIDIRLERAGLLPEPFPYPFIATGFNIVITDGGATATAESLVGLTGASGELLAAIEFADEAENKPGSRVIDIELTGGPVDDLLLAATPAPDEAGADNLLDALGGLRVSGDLSGSIVIDSATPEEFTAALRLRNLGLALPPEEGATAPALAATGLSGPMMVTDRRVVVGPISGTFRDSPLLVRGFWRERAPGEGAAPVVAHIDVEDFDAAWPIGPVIGLLGDDAAARWDTLRAERGLAARADVSVLLQLPADEPPEVRTTVRNVRGLRFNALSGRVAIDELAGEIVADKDAIRLVNVSGDARLDERLSGRLSADGSIALREGGPMTLEATLTEQEFDGALLRALVGDGDDVAGVRRWLGARRPSGTADALLSLVRDDEGAPGWTVTVIPRDVSLKDGDRSLHLAGAGGRAVVRPGGGTIESLRLEGPELAIACDGRWRLGERPAVDLDFDIDAQRLATEALLLTPGGVRDLFGSLEIGIDGAFRLSEGALRWRRDSSRFDARLEFTGLRCEPGVRVSDAAGRAEMRVEFSEERTDPEIEIDIRSDRMRLAGVAMTDGDISLRTADLPGRLNVDLRSANAHGGRVTGVATIDTVEADPASVGYGADEAGAWYEVELDFAGVEVGSLLGDAASNANGSGDESGTPIDRFTGTFDGRLSLAGSATDESTRRGRGVFRVHGGELSMAPLMIPIIELSNLRAPTGERLERADAEVYLEGGLAHVEELRVRSGSISIVGAGVVTWPEMGLDMVFNSQSNRRVPILSDVVEALRNELITTVVGGTLLAPEFRTEVFSGTRQALDEIFGETRRGRPRPVGDAIPRAEDPDGISSMPENEQD